MAALVLAAACSSETGTIRVELTTAPGSTILDGVQTLRMELTNPPQVVTAERTASGFSLAIDLTTDGTSGALLVDGFDTTGELVATGATPRFSLGAVDGRVVIYMAAPESVGVAPEVLDVARSELGAAALPYGAIFIGGRTATGAASASVDIYNAYDHSVVSGLPLPSPRVAPAVGVGLLGAYVFGGLDEAGTETASLWRFDTNAAPNGAYLQFGDKTGFARAGEALVPLGNDRFLLTGEPAGDLAADGTLGIRDDIASLPAVAVGLVASDGMATWLFASDTALVRLRGGVFDTLATPGRTGAALVALPGGKGALVCGTTDAIRIDGASGAAETFPAVPSTPTTGCAAAASRRHVVIAGGTTAAGVTSAVEIFDAVTLAPVATATLAVPRTGAVAIALPNDQLLIAGGVDESGAPVATLELFTPRSR